MPKRGLPTSVQMKHDSHYVDEIARASRSIGKMIPIVKIKPNPDQPRVEFGDLTELTSSIKQQGVLEPLLVKPIRESSEYMIIAGERRWRASNLAGLEEVPCIELDIDENAIAEIALVENLQRKDLNLWEIADGLADLSERFGYTHDEIAQKIGKSRTTVTESMAIAGLPQDIRDRCNTAKITSKSTLVEISRQFDVDAMHHLLDKIENDGLNRKKIRKQKSTSNKSENDSLNGKNPSDDIIENSVKLSEENSKNIFRFSSKQKRFDLQIKFETDEFDDMDILKALKEAFDAVKAR